MTNNVTSTGASATLVQQLFKHADLNHDGQVSTAEFGQFLSDALAGAESPVTPGSGQPSYQDRLSGFDVSRLGEIAKNAKEAFANLAQFMEPTEANLQRIAGALSPAGALSSDGASLALANGAGRVTVGDGSTPMWQWTTGGSLQQL